MRICHYDDSTEINQQEHQQLGTLSANFIICDYLKVSPDIVYTYSTKS